MTQTELPPLLTFKEAMVHLRVSRSTLYRLLWSGKLTGYKVGASWRFYKDDVQHCITWTLAKTPPCLMSDDEMPDIRLDAQYQQI